jgi:hypothetical protein
VIKVINSMMTIIEQISSGVLRKESVGSHVTAFEWFLIHMGWSLEIDELNKK